MIRTLQPVEIADSAVLAASDGQWNYAAPVWDHMIKSFIMRQQ